MSTSSGTRGDTMVLTAATEAETIRAAVAAGALSYWSSRSPAELAAGWPDTRATARSVRSNLSAQDVDAALDALRPRSPRRNPDRRLPTKKLVLQALRASDGPMSSAEVARDRRFPGDGATVSGDAGGRR